MFERNSYGGLLVHQLEQATGSFLVFPFTFTITIKDSREPDTIHLFDHVIAKWNHE